MPSYFVQNATQPVESEHRAGVHIVIGLNSEQAAMEAFLATYPADEGDQIEVVRADAFKAWDATAEIVMVPDTSGTVLPDPNT